MKKTNRRKWFEEHQGTYTFPDKHKAESDLEGTKSELKRFRENREIINFSIKNAFRCIHVKWIGDEPSVTIRSDGFVELLDIKDAEDFWRKSYHRIEEVEETIQRIEALRKELDLFMDQDMDFKH